MDRLGGGLLVAFQIWMLWESYRRGQAWPWFLIILCFPGIGALAYFMLEVQTVVPLGGSTRGGGSVQFRRHRVTGEELRKSAAEVRRLDNAAAWSDHAGLLRARGRHAEAAEAAARALEKDADDLHARYERGRALLALGRASDALADLRGVVAREPQHDYGDALLALAKAQEATGDLAAARTSYETLAERSSRPDVLYHLAEIQHRTGDAAAAQATLEGLLADAELTPAFAQGRTAPWLRRARRALKALDG